MLKRNKNGFDERYTGTCPRCASDQKEEIKKETPGQVYNNITYLCHNCGLQYVESV